MKIERLMYIIISLLSKKHIHAKDISEKFKVSIRTIYRDIDTLTLAGIPIYSQRGSNGGFYVDENYKMNNLLFTDTEKRIIQELSKSISTSFYNSSFEALSKKMEYFMQGKKQSNSSYFFDFSLWKMNQESFNNIENAIEKSLVIEMKYTSFENETTLRKVEPINLVYKSHTWYLYAFCKTKNDFRLFRISRIRDLKILNYHFDSEQYDGITTEDIANFFNEIRRKTNCEKVCLEFSLDVRAKVYDTFSKNDLIEYKDKIVVNKEMPIDDWFIGVILGFKSSVKVISPISLQKKIKQIALEIFSQYEIQ